MVTHNYEPGGLMRCCTATLAKRAKQGPPDEDEVLPCDHCADTMRYTNGAWRWDTTAPL